MDHAQACRLLQRTAQKHGLEELPLAQGQGWQPRVPGCVGLGAAERGYPTSKEWQLHGHRRAERSYSMSKVRRGGREEIPLVQDRIRSYVII